MSDDMKSIPPEWELGDWEKVLTINVGAAYCCRQCGNLVMVTKGGVGLMDLVCCGKPMEKLGPPKKGGKK